MFVYYLKELFDSQNIVYFSSFYCLSLSYMMGNIESETGNDTTFRSLSFETPTRLPCTALGTH